MSTPLEPQSTESAAGSDVDASQNGTSAVPNGKEKKSASNGKAKKGADASPGDWSFPYMLANKWNVWYDRPAAKKQQRGEFNTSMKHIYQFDSVKAFWGLYNHLDLHKMPVGANIRIFKHDIQPTWEDPQNRQGGNWILVPKGDIARQVFKELLLALIGGDLAKYVNGIVMSTKAKDVIIQIWIKKKEKKDSVKRDVFAALEAYWKAEPDGRRQFEKNDVWTWRAHPTASLSLKDEDTENDSLNSTIPLGKEAERGHCGECLRTWKSDGCSVQ